MFLFNHTPFKVFDQSVLFKYIICSYSTLLDCIYVNGVQDLNTSYVPIQLESQLVILGISLFKYIICSYSTAAALPYSSSLRHLNTSYVPIQRHLRAVVCLFL